MATIEEIIYQTAVAEGIDPYLALSVAKQESGFNQFAVGDGGHSHGLFQENFQGRGAGRDPDYDPVRQTQRFASEVRAYLAAGGGGSPGEVGYAVQRPADRGGYIAAINAGYNNPGEGSGGVMAHSDQDWRAPQPSGGGTGSPLVDKVDLGGSWLLSFLDGSTKVWPKDQAMPKSSTDNTVGLANVALGYAQLGQSGANSQQSAYMQALSLEEQRRQFNEQFGMDKAKFNISTGETQRQYDETFGYNKAKFNAEFGENQRQYNETFGMEKAKFNIRQQFEEAVQKWNEAKDARDFGAAEHWKGRADELARMQFGEDQRQYNTSTGLDYYKHLGEMASNPRNFMQNFFLNRGQDAPPGSEQFANTGQNLNAVKPFEQFLPGFIQAVMGGQSGGQDGYAGGGAGGSRGYGPAGGGGSRPGSGQSGSGRSNASGALPAGWSRATVGPPSSQVYGPGGQGYFTDAQGQRAHYGTPNDQIPQEALAGPVAGAGSKMTINGITYTAKPVYNGASFEPMLNWYDDANRPMPKLSDMYAAGPGHIQAADNTRYAPTNTQQSTIVRSSGGAPTYSVLGPLGEAGTSQSVMYSSPGSQSAGPAGPAGPPPPLPAAVSLANGLSMEEFMKRLAP